ncbi:MAG TPA: universal stress protein [Streptosporangiaceae bacterium]|jgi:nucleotide-binding universal stress UspA family protein
MDEPRRRNELPRPGPLPAHPGREPVERAAVVIGLDGSQTSWDAFWWGCGEARRTSGRAVAVFVSSMSEASMAAMVSAATGIAVCDYDEGERAAAGQARLLEAEVARRTAGVGPAVAFVHAQGDPARELLRVADDVRADLIVVGRSTKARHRLAGSLGRYLITKRSAPIVVVVP